MIRVELVPLSRAAAHLGALTGRRPHVSTLLRWILRGVRGRKLPAVRVGNEWRVALADVDAFVIPGPSEPEVCTAHRAEVERLQLAALMGRPTR